MQYVHIYISLYIQAPRSDIDSGFFNRVQSVARAKNPNVKVLLAMGGWTDSGATSVNC